MKTADKDDNKPTAKKNDDDATARKVRDQPTTTPGDEQSHRQPQPLTEAMPELQDGKTNNERSTVDVPTDPPLPTALIDPEDPAKGIKVTFNGKDVAAEKKVYTIPELKKLVGAKEEHHLLMAGRPGHLNDPVKINGGEQIHSAER